MIKELEINKKKFLKFIIIEIINLKLKVVKKLKYELEYIFVKWFWKIRWKED